MSDLTEFLLARITEDESRIETWQMDDVSFPHDEEHEPSECDECDRRESQMLADERLAARFHAECRAKRRIIELHQIDADGAFFDICRECGHHSGSYDTASVDWPCPTLHALALPYADHPDFPHQTEST